MKLFGLTTTRSKPAPVTRSFDTTAWLTGKDFDSGPSLQNAYEQVVWVYRAINILAEQVSNIPFLFSTGERGRENLITSGPLLDFYAHPYPTINRFQYWELRIIWLMLRGECFRVPIFEDARSSSSLSPSHAETAGEMGASPSSLSPSYGDHVPQRGHETSGTQLVAGLGSHWAGERGAS